MKSVSIVQSAVIGPVQLTTDPSHRLLWMEVQADAQTCTWQHTTCTRRSCLRGIWNMYPSNLGAADPSCRLRGDWDRMFMKIETELRFIKSGGSLNINWMV